MATLRNKRKLAAVSRDTPENTRNRTDLIRGWLKSTSPISEEIEARVTKKLPGI